MESLFVHYQYCIKSLVLLWGILLSSLTLAQTTGTIAGRVLTVDAKPMAQVTVRLINGRIGALTNEQGEFTLIRFRSVHTRC